MKTSYKKERLREILTTSAKYGFKNGWGSPRDFRLLLEELGPSFVKIGQLLSTRPDLLPSPYIEELRGLQDNVAPIGYDEIEKLLEEELAGSLEDFSWLEKEALAAASLSQVHLAQLKTGEKVVVKVQRPGVKEKILTDLSLLKKISPLINLAPTRDLLDIDQVIEELDSAIRKEVNFLEEGANMLTFAANNRSVNFISSPTVYQGYSTEKVLVMDYIDGIKIDQLALLEKEGYDLEDLASKLVYNYFQQVFDQGFFHADPHPGNILIDGPSISYIDFGLMGRLGPSILKKLNNLLDCLVKKDTRGLTRAILSIGIELGPVDFNRLHHDISLIYKKYIDESIYNFDLNLILNEIISICRENNIAMPKDVTLLAKGILTLQGVLTGLGQDLSLMEVALPYFKNKLLRENFSKLDLFELGLEAYASLDSIYQMPGQLNNLLDQAQDKDLELKVRLTHLDWLTKKVGGMVNRLLTSIIILALLISSSLLVRENELRSLGSLGYILAGILGLVLLLSIYRSSRD